MILLCMPPQDTPCCVVKNKDNHIHVTEHTMLQMNMSMLHATSKDSADEDDDWDNDTNDDENYVPDNDVNIMIMLMLSVMMIRSSITRLMLIQRLSSQTK